MCDFPGVLADDFDRIVTLHDRAGIDQTTIHQHSVAIDILGVDRGTNPQNIVGVSGPDDRDRTVQIVKRSAQLFRYQRNGATNPAIVAANGPVLEALNVSGLRGWCGGGSGE